MANIFCPLPWIQVATRNNGDFRVCAPANSSPEKGILRNENGEPLNARNAGFEDARNAPLLNDIRRSILKGEWHPNCIRCKREVEAGLRARGQYEAELRRDIIDTDKARALTADDGSIDAKNTPLAMLDIRFGNRCNLRCRTCNPTESDSWYDDHAKLYGPGFKYGDQRLTLSPGPRGQMTLADNYFDWFDSEDFWPMFTESLKDVREIHFSGGEPLKTKAHSRMLHVLIESGRAPEISIEYNTNGYQMPDDVWEQWNRFRQVKIGLSMDSFGAMNDYIRYPSRWNIVERHLRKFDAQDSRFVTWLTFTVHNYNIFYLPEIIAWRIDADFENINGDSSAPLFSDHPVHDPKHLNVQSLPAAIKSAVAEKFEAFKPRLPEIIDRNAFMRRNAEAAHRHALRLLDGYVDYMFSADLSEYHEKFLNYTANLDRIRKNDFAATFPDFYKLLRASGAKKDENAGFNADHD